MSLKIRGKYFGVKNPNITKIAMIKSVEKNKQYLYLDTSSENGDDHIKLEGRKKFQPVPIKIKNQ